MIIRQLKRKVKQKDKYKKGYNEIDYNFITKYYNNPLNPVNPIIFWFKLLTKISENN